MPEDVRWVGHLGHVSTLTGHPFEGHLSIRLRNKKSRKVEFHQLGRSRNALIILGQFPALMGLRR